ATLATRGLITSTIDATGAVRWHLPDPVRALAAAALTAAGETRAVQARHRDAFVTLAEQAAAAMSGPTQAAQYARLEVEQAHLRAALAASLTFPEDTTAVHAAARLVAALVRFWEAMGYLREGRRWCERVLAMDVPLPAQVRAAVLNGAG